MYKITHREVVVIHISKQGDGGCILALHRAKHTLYLCASGHVQAILNKAHPHVIEVQGHTAKVLHSNTHHTAAINTC